MKQAYLIMVHNNWNIVKKNLRLIDYEKNDIYIHIDAKIRNIDIEEIRNICKKSNVYFIDQSKIYWGDYSMVDCTIQLLKAAIKKKYDYYHLISGADLLLKSQNDIEKFLEKNNGVEYIHFCDLEGIKESEERVKKFYFTKYQRGKIGKVISVINKTSIKIQDFLKYERNKNLEISKGSNWFSITDYLANKIVEEEIWIENTFKGVMNPDEHFLQMFIINKKINIKLYEHYGTNKLKNSLRDIDWERGRPYVFREADFDELIESNLIFARKFDEKIDNKIVDMIFKYVKEGDQ